MRETEQRIKEYQKMLPVLKGKVTSAVFFFIISILMMTSAAFAWLTVSSSPEIKGMETIVAANGNLEIALSDIDGEQPEESQVGDGQKELLEKNLTWGNLVNLSSAEYGLGEIELRPALLNTGSLLERPLYAASYGADGRVEKLVSDFAYTNYDSETGEFRVLDTPKMGVRAVSSVTYTFAGGAQAFQERLNLARISLSEAIDEYNAIAAKNEDGTNNDNMLAIADLLNMYLDDRFNDAGTNYKPHLGTVKSLMEDFQAVMNQAGEAMVHIANLQMMLEYGSSKPMFTAVDELLNISEAKLKSDYNVTIKGISTYKSDKSNLEKYLVELDQMINDPAITQVLWQDIAHIVNFLVNIETTLVGGTPVSQINSDNIISVGMSFLGNPVATIQGGALYNMELLLGTYINVTDLQIMIPILNSKANVTVRTSAVNAAEKEFLPSALDAVENSDNENFIGTDPVAADTYGIAIDFWVRSNAAKDYLLLEGNTIVESRHKTDKDGNYYYIDQDTGAVIIKRSDGKYYDEYGNEASGDNLKEYYEDVVIGYEGANRVWDDATMSKNSTTQGNGSCYIFYADSPQDQKQSLEVLKSMCVVFIDEGGNPLAYADMDTESSYALNGRVTVPLKLRNDSVAAGTDQDGNPIYAITQLEQGEAKRITALLYINGFAIKNSEVLAASNIQGQLNLQFGSSVTMDAMEDEAVKSEEIKITGSAAPSHFVYGEGELKSKVTLNILGVSPESVKANFIRVINGTQGTRQETIVFNGENGQYEADVTFDAPGNYVLRSVIVDGIEYMLDTPIEIQIEGFAISQVWWANPSNYKKVMTSDTSRQEEIKVQFSGSGVDIHTVQGIFENSADNQWMTVDMVAQTDGWRGNVSFSSSGVYVLKYFLVNGEYYEIPSEMQKTLDLSLGMSGEIRIEDSVYEYMGERSLPVSMVIRNNVGEELKSLNGVKVQYNLQGSHIEEGGLSANLTWNADTNQYEGAFDVIFPGAYAFAYFMIDADILYEAEATLVQAIPPIPPEFHAGESEEYVYSAEQNVDMGAAVTNSQAVTGITAVMEKDGKTIEVVGTKGLTETLPEEESLTHWTFKLPTDEELNALNAGTKQSGTWTIRELKVIGTYKDGVLYTEDNPLVLPVSGSGLTTKVANNLSVKFEGTGQTFNVTFMTACTVSDLAVVITDEHGTIFDVEDINLSYTLENVVYSDTNGFGTDSATAEKVESMKTISVGLSQESEGSTRYRIDEPLTFQLIGTYELDRVTFEIAGQKYGTELLNGETNRKRVSTTGVEPSYTVNWTMPDVEITGITPTEGKTISVCTFRGVWSNSYSTFTPGISEDKHSCWTAKQADKKWYGPDYTGTNPSVTLKVSDLGNNFTTATMLFDGSSHDATFEFKPDKEEVTSEVGGSTANWPYNLGSAVAVSTLTVTNEDQGIVYNFKVNTVTIECKY